MNHRGNPALPPRRFSTALPTETPSPATLASEAEAFAARITRASRSNLALAFFCLPKDRRRDMTIFYAFCRLIDDIADEPGPSIETKRQQLTAWRRGLEGGPGLAGEDELLCHLLRGLVTVRGVDPAHYQALIDGVEMDLDGRRYANWQELQVYCHRVASVVGLVSIRLFGCRQPASEEYALALGLAFQLTNIIRDVGRDYRNGARIYLPLDELAAHGVTEMDLAGGKETVAFRRMLAAQAERAAYFYAEAVRHWTPEDGPALRAAEIMHAVYGRLLAKIARSGFDVLSREHRLTKFEKLAAIARATWAGWLNKPTANPVQVLPP